MTTIVMPAYIQNSQTKVKTLIGVVGIDVVLTVLQKVFGLSDRNIYEEFPVDQNFYSKINFEMNDFFTDPPNQKLV